MVWSRSRGGSPLLRVPPGGQQRHKGSDSIVGACTSLHLAQSLQVGNNLTAENANESFVWEKRRGEATYHNTEQ